MHPIRQELGYIKSCLKSRLSFWNKGSRAKCAVLFPWFFAVIATTKQKSLRAILGTSLKNYPRVWVVERCPV